LKEEIYLNQQFRDALPEPEQYGWDKDNTEFVIITEINPDDQLEAYVENFNQESIDECPVELTQFTEFNALAFKDFEGSTSFYLPQNYASLYSCQTMIEDTSNITLLNSYILPGENGKSYISYGLPYNELKSFPAGDIYIDPTIRISGSSTHDTWLESIYFFSVYHHHKLLLGKAKGFPKKRTVVRFPLYDIPDSSKIQNASLNLYYYGIHRASWSHEVFIPRDISANLILVPWNEYTATYKYPWSVPYGAFGVDYASTSEDVVHFDRPPAWKSFNLTSAVQKWVDGEINNQGVVL